MPIVVNQSDVMMARRHKAAGELARGNRHHPGEPVNFEEQQGQSRAVSTLEGFAGAGLPAGDILEFVPDESVGLGMPGPRLNPQTPT